MPAARTSAPGLVARALAEAIDSVATPPVRDSILAGALREAGLQAIPERGQEVLEFASGALRKVLSMRVGDATASEVLRQLGPLLQRVALRGSRPPRRSSPAGGHGGGAPFAEVRGRAQSAGGAADDDDSGVFVASRAVTDPAPQSAVPVVFLASRDAAIAKALAARLGGRATVRMVDGLLDLLDALDEDDESEVRVVVIDGHSPAVQVPSLATVAPEVSERAHVLLWRCGAADRRALEVHAPGGAWRACGASLDDLANACGRAIR